MSLSNILSNGDTKATFKQVSANQIFTESLLSYGDITTDGGINATSGTAIVNRCLIEEKLFLTKQTNALLAVSMATPTASPNKPQGIITLDFSTAPLGAGSAATFTLNSVEITNLTQMLLTKGPFADAGSAGAADDVYISVQQSTAGSAILRIKNKGAGAFNQAFVFTYLIC